MTAVLFRLEYVSQNNIHFPRKQLAWDRIAISIYIMTDSHHCQSIHQQSTKEQNPSMAKIDAGVIRKASYVQNTEWLANFIYDSFWLKITGWSSKEE